MKLKKLIKKDKNNIYSSTLDYVKITDFKELFQRALNLYGDNIAFKYKNKETKQIKAILRSQFIQDYQSLGTALYNLGHKRKHIAILSENRYEWCVSYAAITCGLGIVVCLDTLLKPNELEQAIIDSDTEIIIYSNKHFETLNNIINKKTSKLKVLINMDLEKSNKKELSFNQLINNGFKDLQNGKDDYLKTKINPSKTSVLLLTSATTSKSKIVELSQKAICTNVGGVFSTFDIVPNETLLSFLPMSHSFECTVTFLYTFATGGTIAFSEGLRYLADNLAEFNTTCLVAVPLVFEGIQKAIMREIKSKNKEKLFKFVLIISNFLLLFKIDLRKKFFKDIHNKLVPNLRYFVSGGAKLSIETQKWFNNIGVTLYQGYGLTETSPIISSCFNKYQKLGSAGILFPSLQVKIHKPNKQGIGEILVKGKTLMNGYYKNKTANKDAFYCDWFKTGDLGKFDKKGYLYITGRTKTVIVLNNGKNIYPDDLEQVLNNIEGVLESYVFLHPFETESSKLCAKLIYDKNYFKDKTEEEIKNILWEEVKKINSQHSVYKYVKEIFISNEELIKTSSRKIKRYEEQKKTEKLIQSLKK